MSEPTHPEPDEDDIETADPAPPAAKQWPPDIQHK